MKLEKFKLFGIDIQNDFITGSLAVPGAGGDVQNIVNLIDRHINEIDSVLLTMDTHPLVHIGHPGYWRDREGNEPAPFTVISKETLSSDDIRTADPDKQEYAVKYVTALHSTTVWPVHCVGGTKGHELNDELSHAVTRWHDACGKRSSIVRKGENPDAEYFGVFAPEYNAEPNFNRKLAEYLLEGELPIVVVGEARSHCVSRSVGQLVEYIKSHGRECGHGDFDMSKIILLEDCMSDVAGCEGLGDAQFRGFAYNGITIAKSTDI